MEGYFDLLPFLRSYLRPCLSSFLPNPPSATLSTSTTIPSMAEISLRIPLVSNRTPERDGTPIRNKAIFAAATIAVVVVLLCTSSNFSDSVEHSQEPVRGIKSKDGIVESEVGVVATDDGRCSEVGVQVLNDGGHVVDSAVATAICLGVVNSMASGIGGGGFMVLRSAQTGYAQAYDFRETAPLAATQTIYENNPAAKVKGPLSIGVPGELAGLHTAWLQHGRIAWKTLFQPSIKLARDGYVVTRFLAAIIKSSAKAIMGDPGLRKIFARKGKLLEAGDICYNPKLALTLEMISEEGPHAFYHGNIGERLARDVQEAGGILTMEDLTHYKVEVSDAMTVNSMGYTILGMPPPSSGTVGLAMVLNILESYGTVDALKGPLGVHRLLESLKHMLAIRMNLGDPDFVDIKETVSDMLSSSYAKKIQEKILDNTTFPAGYYLSKWSQLRDHGTSHLCIVDADRNALSMTTTVNSHFGSDILSPSTGIVLNNEMDDFSTPSEITSDELPPAPSNFVEPNKRPLSSMNPIIILKDNQLAGAVGASGGLYIIPVVIQVVLNHFVFGMDPLAAVQHPRVYHKLIPNVVLCEDWTFIDGDHIELTQETKVFLEQLGHVLKDQADGGICQLVVHDLQNSVSIERNDGRGELSNNVFHGMLSAVSDPRKDGRPAGI